MRIWIYVSTFGVRLEKNRVAGWEKSPKIRFLSTYILIMTGFFEYHILNSLLMLGLGSRWSCDAELTITVPDFIAINPQIGIKLYQTHVPKHVKLNQAQ